MIIKPILHDGRRDLHQAEAEEVALPELVALGEIVLLRHHGVDELAVLGVVGADIRIIVVDRQVGDPAVAGEGRVADRHLPAVFEEEHRQHAQRLVLLVLQRLVRARVHGRGRVLVAAEQPGRARVRAVAVGDRVGIVGEARKLPRKLRVFRHEVGQIGADRAVEHDDDHVFALFAEREARLFARHVPRRLPDLRHRGLDLDDVHSRHAEHGERQHQIHALHEALFAVQQGEDDRDRGQDREVQQLFLHGEGHAGVVFQIRRQRPEIRAEEHIVDHGDPAGDPDERAEHAARAGRGHVVEDPHPDDEEAEGEQRGVAHMAQRRIEVRREHELRRRGGHHSRGDQQPRQGREEHAAADKQARVLLRQLRAGRSAELAAQQIEREREHQQQRDRQHDRFLLPVFGVEEEQPEDQQRGAGRREQTEEERLRVFETAEQVLEERKQVVQRPVQHQAGGRAVQQHKEDQRHTVELQLVLERKTPGVDRARHDVDERHQNRQHMDRHARDRQQTVRRAEVGDGAEGHPAQLRKVREEVVGRDEERDLQHERQRALERVEGLVVVLAVVGLEHHEALVAGEALFDMRHPGREPLLDLPLLCLDGVRAPVERQQQEVHRQAQREDRESRVIQNQVGQAVDELEDQLERPDQQLIQAM